MANEILRSRHVFGAEANVATALAEGKIDEYDILFLTDGDDHKIGWIDKQGNVVIPQDKKEIEVVVELPETGVEGVIYVVGTVFYVWDGEKFVTNTVEGGVSAEEVDTKIEASEAAMKTYVDEQVALAVEVVEI